MDEDLVKVYIRIGAGDKILLKGRVGKEFKLNEPPGISKASGEQDHYIYSLKVHTVHGTKERLYKSHLEFSTSC